MSRYEVQCYEPEKLLCVVGWDAPLETFFAQVIDRRSLDTSEREKAAAEAEYDHTNIILWRGTEAGELPTVGDLSAAVGAGAELPRELACELEGERAASRKPTALQRRMNELFAPGGLRT